jgi:hypothetical protein
MAGLDEASLPISSISGNYAVPTKFDDTVARVRPDYSTTWSDVLSVAIG